MKHKVVCSKSGSHWNQTHPIAFIGFSIWFAPVYVNIENLKTNRSCLNVSLNKNVDWKQIYHAMKWGATMEISSEMYLFRGRRNEPISRFQMSNTSVEIPLDWARRLLEHFWPKLFHKKKNKRKYLKVRIIRTTYKFDHSKSLKIVYNFK